MKVNEKKNLGRGLSALMGDLDLNESLLLNEDDRIISVQISDVIANINQPRKSFDEISLHELSKSIQSKGIISPIIVRRNKVDNKYEIIAGERRFRAAQIAKLEKVPVIIKEATDTNALEIGLIENLQRQDLNAVEEAEAYRSLMEKYSYNQNDIAVIVGKSRSYIANVLRLLNLPPYVLEILRSGKISVGHARSLIGLESAEELANKIMAEGLSVRQVERIVRGEEADTPYHPREWRPSTPSLSSIPLDESAQNDIKTIETLLVKKLNTIVKITPYHPDAGNIMIEYKSLEELDNILQLLSK